MTEKPNSLSGVKGLVARVPQILARVLIVATAVYFIGFLWVFTGGNVVRLFIPFQWKIFFTERQYAEVIYDKWFFYGTSLPGLFINWLIMLALIAGAYYAYAFIVRKKDQ